MRNSATDWFEVEVYNRFEEAPKIFSFELIALDGIQLPGFTAGAHIEVKVGEFIRHYSLVYPQEATSSYVICVLQENDGRGGSKSICESLRPGDRIQVRGPHNNFPLSEAAGPAVLLAGGIGITPLISMAEQLHREGRAFTLHYCTRSRTATAFISRLRAAPYAASVQFHFSDESSAGKPDLKKLLRGIESNSELYICGPSGMIESAMAVAADLGHPSRNVHVERFAEISPALDTDSSNNKPFWLELYKSGKRVLVPANRTAVQVLRESGVKIDISCEAGACGTCITAVLSGVPDHRDSVLSEEEKISNALFTPCCSRAITDGLVVDL